MAKKKFERRHLTEDEIARVLHRGQEPTEAENEICKYMFRVY